MDKSTLTGNERISALADGGLDGEEATRAMDALLTDAVSAQTWHAYHVVGDVLRSPALAPAQSDLDFWLKLESKLAQEPRRPPVTPEPVWVAAEHSANAQAFRWKAVAGMASVAFVGVFSLTMWNSSQTPGAVQVSAAPAARTQSPQRVAGSAQTGVMIRDLRLDELMAEHRQLGGHSAFQMSTGFLRNATYEEPAR